MASPINQQASYCTLDAHARLSSPTSLQLHYRVQSNTDRILFLINRFWTSIDANRQYQVQPNMANVAVAADRVTIGKTVVPVPDDMEVEKHYTPCLTRLAPYEIYEETLEIAVPLAPFTWYQAPWHLPAAGAERAARCPLYFALGYLVAGPGREAALRPVATSQGPAYTWNIEPEDQLVIGAGPLLPDVSVLLY